MGPRGREANETELFQHLPAQRLSALECSGQGHPHLVASFALVAAYVQQKDLPLTNVMGCLKTAERAPGLTASAKGAIL